MRSRVGKDAKLIVMIPTGGHARDAVTQSFNSYKTGENDPAAYFVDLGKIEFATCDGLHPTTTGHEQIFKASLSAFDAILTTPVSRWTCVAVNVNAPLSQP